MTFIKKYVPINPNDEAKLRVHFTNLNNNRDIETTIQLVNDFIVDIDTFNTTDLGKSKLKNAAVIYKYSKQLWIN